ncbi:hypothetical protein [Acinetobacter sp. BSP-28]|uniref:hypothetical protein n=1 Tax=Acinetobacter sp. BSP-28 TaxID=3344661 RepID=UPI00376F9408
MATFLIVFGLMCVVGLPAYAIFYITPKVKPDDWKAGAPFLLMLPGFFIFAYGLYLNSDKPITVSTACGTVQYYKKYSTGKQYSQDKSFERITLQLDDSKYFRHFRFVENLERKNENDHVCFNFHDRKKNPQLSESKILKWFDH